MNDLLERQQIEMGYQLNLQWLPGTKIIFLGKCDWQRISTPRMNGTFRWCTDRLKINEREYIQKVIDDEGKEVVVLLSQERLRV